MESAVIDLPEPDSPAMQSVSPAARSKESSSTTTREPSGVATSVVRPRTVRTSPDAPPAAGGAGGFVHAKTVRGK